MNLAERLANAKPSPRGLPCPIAVILTHLEPEEREAFTDHLWRDLDDPERLPNTTLAQVLTEAGHRVHYKGVESHRNMKCRCFTGTGK